MGLGARHKYESIRDHVLDVVDSLEIGAAIPPERELCQRFGVSRMTLRRAVDELVREGLLERKQGRGTYVAAPKVGQQLTMTSFSEDMRRRGLVPGSRTLSLSQTTAGAQLGWRLEVPPQAQVLRARRLRLADGRPMALETLHVPCALAPDLTAEELTDASFYEVMAAKYGLEIASGVQSVEPTVINAEEAEVLEAPEHSPAFLFERTSRTAGGVVVEFVRSVYRGDRYQLIVELLPSRARTHPAASHDDQPRPPAAATDEEVAR